ncbi:hypothetical protein [Serinicoccus sediminis]|uniref:hypothetical protein n=1 Tax=Serinicoccus sediminis TaxID=2306021 RepID=UPI00101E9A6D|nr:hypothetical protein [Serinicoccus sediminis]
MSTRRGHLIALAAGAFTATGGTWCLAAFAYSWWIHPEHRPTVRGGEPIVKTRRLIAGLLIALAGGAVTAAAAPAQEAGAVVQWNG